MSDIRMWKEKGRRLVVEYSVDAVEHLRQRSIEGLLSLPRVGMGVGGLLVGTHRGDGIEILETLPIPCSHALGPGFQLTPDEMAQAKQIGKVAQPRIVVGCYCSKTRAWGDITESDLLLFAAICPEKWQVMLQIKPSTVEDSRFALCHRDSAGKVVRGLETTLLNDPGREELAPAPAPVRAEKKNAGHPNMPLIFAAVFTVIAAVTLLFMK